MKNKKEENKKLSNIAAFIIVIMIMIMSIISIEVIIMIYSEKINLNLIDNTLNTTTADKVKKYDISSLSYNIIEITDQKMKIKKLCNEECNIKISMYGSDFFYIFKKDNNEYNLTILKGNVILAENKKLGKTLDGAYFAIYMDYILFYNIIDIGEYQYDYAILVDNRSYVDEFSSIEDNEMEFTDDGIIYYYDICTIEEKNNAKRVKALRYPYTNDHVEIDYKEKNYNWCN